VQLWS